MMPRSPEARGAAMEAYEALLAFQRRPAVVSNPSSINSSATPGVRRLQRAPHFSTSRSANRLRARWTSWRAASSEIDLPAPAQPAASWGA